MTEAHTLAERLEATATEHDAAGLYRALPKEVLLAIAASALDVPVAEPSAATLVALVTEWHILHTAGTVAAAVPVRFRHLVRAGIGPQASLDPGTTEVGHLYTTKEAAELLHLVPRTVRKLAQAHEVGSKVGPRNRVFSTADIGRLRALSGAPRPDVRSDTQWR